MNVQVKRGKINTLSGSESAAISAAICEPDIIPLNMQTRDDGLTQFLERIRQSTSKLVPVDNTSAGIGMCLGAHLIGARTFVSASGQDLLRAHELLHTIAGLRKPVVMSVVSRGAGAPRNDENDHSDILFSKDTGWIQIVCETNQEVFDTVMQAYMISEHNDVRLPVMVCFDTHATSNAYESVAVPSQEQARAFLKPYAAQDTLDSKKPLGIGGVIGANAFTEVKRLQDSAMKHSVERIRESNKEFKDVFSRSYGNGLIENYQVENAQTVIVAMGSVCGLIREYIDETKASLGLLRIRTLSPFPSEDVRSALLHAEKVIVLERAAHPSGMGMLYTQVKAAIEKKKCTSIIAGVGGRSITKFDIETMLRLGASGKQHWVNSSI
ncbi:hypothetical protein COT72_02970 [archaeon CG10_big_fil_rev_8_21_14_0_10_43_11]|nr:MAG: hypothetical protein COT72_02970 [archaeon CG10_big_fil_rev_8_21_14_0_10_43_11]